MALLPLSPPPDRRRNLKAALILIGAAAAFLAVLAPSTGYRGALLFTGCLLVPTAWIALVARSRTVLFNSEHRTVTVRWRSAVFERRSAELSLERFACVVSYHPLGTPPAIRVALLERGAGRALVIAELPAKYQRRGFWSSLKLVEGDAAKQLRISLSIKVDIPDGGYKGTFPGLWASERQ